ncbi:MAG: hypothetical protein NTU53_00760, partial [Planctomycetota bacterium]|nr:hypothetical protein [Planctomycetota bacterium]
MNPNDLAPEEEQFARLLAALEADAPPPDEQLRERLRARSIEAFVSQSSPTESPRVHISRRRSPMFVFAWRALAGSAAAAVLAASFFFVRGPAGDAATAFGKVLDNVANAKSLQVEVTLDGKKTQLWAGCGRLRWDQPDGTYQIAR